MAHGETTATPAAGQASMQDPPASANPTEHWHLALPAADSALAGHVSHAAVPTTPLNVPASHSAHATPSEAAVYPGRHAQSVNMLLPAAEVVFEGHVEQLTAPTALLNVPASHAAHATPSEAAVYPDRHLQAASSMLPAAEMDFEGHAAQLPEPAVALYVPASHATHAQPSAPVNPAVYPAGQGPRHSGTEGRLSPISPLP
jgi:hypothetical protein